MPIEVGFAGPAEQRRVTVLFRLILIIPQFFFLALVGIAAEIVLFLGWFGALFTGRLPEFAADFLSGVLRWQARVNAYHLLMTDQYPPFSLEDTDYPVRVAMRPGRLNRLAVLFRFILVIPASIVVGVVTYGLQTIALFVIWLIVLISGRMPPSLHEAISAVLRYSARVTGYIFMLTSEYPGGLFGDQAGPGGQPGTAAYPAWWYGTGGDQPGGYQPEGDQPGGYQPEGDQPGGYQPEGDQTGGYQPEGDQTGGYPAAPGFPSAAGSAPAPAQPPAYGDQQVSGTEGYQPVSGTGPAPAGGSPAPAWGQAAPPPGSATPYGTAPAAGSGQQPAPAYGTPQAMSKAGWSVPGSPPWPLVLSREAKQLVGLFIGLGVIIAAGYFVFIAVLVSHATRTESRAAARSQSTAAFHGLSTSMTAFGTQTTACRASHNPLPCVIAADRKASAAFGVYASAQSGIGMPTSSTQKASSLIAADATHAQQIFQQLSASTSVAQYEQRANASNLQQVLTQLQQTYTALETTLARG
jgi:Domain of unknown function (DUF4389)